MAIKTMGNLTNSTLHQQAADQMAAPNQTRSGLLAGINLSDPLGKRAQFIASKASKNPAPTGTPTDPTAPAPAPATPAAPAAPAAPATPAAPTSPYQVEGYTPYELPYSDEAKQQLRDLQTKSLTGFTALMNEDPNADVSKLQSAIYDPQQQAIDRAAALQYHQMVEGNFARGVGSSSITTDLAGKLAQSHDAALANANQSAYVAAKAQANQDLASRLGLLQGAFGAGTTGMQAEANVGLANAANAQQAYQFAKNLGFQGTQNDLNRALQSSEFSQNLSLQQQQIVAQTQLAQAQMEQQASQFQAGLAFTGQQNDANRALQQAMQASQFQFTGDQNALSQAFQQTMAQMGYDFQGDQNAANRALQQAMQTQQLTQQQGQFNANQTLAQQQMSQQQAQFAASQAFAGDQNAANRALQAWMQTQALAAQGDQHAQSIVAGGLGSFLTGLGGLAGLFGNPPGTSNPG